MKISTQTLKTMLAVGAMALLLWGCAVQAPGPVAASGPPSVSASPLAASVASAVSVGAPATPGALAPRHTYAPGSPTYYRNTHGEKDRVEVFRKDPNIWVYTPEVAARAGLPLEYASTELKGVAAAAFRMQRDGAEEDCGWGGNRNACKPVMECVLELYFDRQAHKLPWDLKRPVADFDWQRVSTAYHLLPALGAVPEANGDASRSTRVSPSYPSLGARQPFTEPQTGEELSFGSRAIAYDREIHGRYAFVRIDVGCFRGVVRAEPMLMQLKKNYNLQDEDWRKDQNAKRVLQVFHEVHLPASWNLRTLQHAAQEHKRTEDFYKQIWNSINQGDKK